MTRTESKSGTSKVGVLIRAAGATLVIGALAIGVPILLTALFGNPLPQQWSWTNPLTDSAILGLLACVAWLFWAQMILCLAVEVVAELRIAAGHSADWLSRVPGTWGGQQALARTLVQAVVAVGLTSAVATAGAGPWVARADATSAQHPLEQSTATEADHTPELGQSTAPTTSAAARSRPSTQTIEVVKGDSLWSIAEQHLGNGERWRELADLNEGRQMPDGSRFRNASSILPGWTLLVPAAPSATTAQALITVESGDTLWGIAEHSYGQGQAWPKILEANRALIEDPDLIFPGQHLRIPVQKFSERAQRKPPADPAQTPTATPPGGVSEQPSSQPTPSPTLTPDAVPPPADETAPTRGSNDAAADAQHDGASTIARALVGGGVFLAAGLLAGLGAKRRNQFRSRRSGRTIAHTPAGLVDAERAMRTTGSAGGEAADFLDLALRDLAANLRRSGGALPEVQAASLSDTHLELFLANPVQTLAPSWESVGDGSRWLLARDSHPSARHVLAPYPTLVSIGADDRGSVWLVDLEAAGLVHLSGDIAAATDLARFIAAELALNPWAEAVNVTLSGLASELTPLNPARLSNSQTLDIEQLAKAARRIREATEATGLDVLEGRLAVDGADSCMPTVLLADLRAAPCHERDTAGLLDELSRTEGRNAIALVDLAPSEPANNGLTLSVDGGGRLVTPWATLNANRLGAAEAKTLAELFAANDAPNDEPMPSSLRDDGTPSDVDTAGALTGDVTDVRVGSNDVSSLLPRSDTDYVSAAATTPADLAVLAPRLSAENQSRIIDADPGLDADLAAWSSTEVTRPKLRVLGPVEILAAGDRPADVQRRPAYYVEMVAYLCMRPGGATTQQMAGAFSIQPNTLHSRIATLRHWLGENPATGAWYLPESTLSAAGKARGIPIYQLDDILCDADLFKRLRTRGQARGPAGIEDLTAALQLVTGLPFDQQRRSGYGWLADTPTDHYLTAAIVDVAHIVATHALAEGQPQVAVWAAERGITAAPSEDKPRLDLARATRAHGRIEESDQYVIRGVFNRSDDDSPPPEPTERTVQVLGLRSK